MCGEHSLICRIAYCRLGSSPHVRGTPLPKIDGGTVVGIIPACAGNTAGARSGGRARRDHPRMCGEHQTIDTWNGKEVGSSPHVRGTQPSRCPISTRTGIIPACAGNTRRFCFLFLLVRDHPRMCGEHGSRQTKEKSFSGSSPHVRGTRSGCCCGVGCFGIIPACAGNTIFFFQRKRRIRDHPRMCGEHTWVPNTKGTLQGSSPHVRGTLVGRLCQLKEMGIIPACAGNTGSGLRGGPGRRDHPRMCGNTLTWID